MSCYGSSMILSDGIRHTWYDTISARITATKLKKMFGILTNLTFIGDEE